MRTTTIASAILALALAGVGHTQTTATLNFKVGNSNRNAVVHVPSGAAKAPVVFFVHGYGGSGAGFENDTKADKVADREKFIAVYPSAVGGSWNMNDESDYPFLLALLDTVDARYKIDRDRVYCTGFSQGGFISFGLGYKHPEVFAAVAPVSGHIPSFSTSAPLKRPVPLFLTFGTSDVSNVASFMTDISTWLKLDSCGSGKRTSQRPYPANRPGSIVSRTTYDCPHGGQVVYDSVIGGTHEWAMDTVKKVNTTEEVWAFLKKFSRSTTTSLSSLPSTATPFTASWRDGRLHVEGIPDGTLVRLMDLRGSIVTTAAVENRSISFAPRSGLYVAAPRGPSEGHQAAFIVP